MATASTSREGSVLAGTWRLVRVLARGGMGTVWEAEHLKLQKRVAVKLLDEDGRDTAARARFVREAEHASRVESPEIVEVFDVGAADDGTPFFVMELLRGETLGQRLRREGRLSPADAVAVVAQCARGLSRAHAAGLVHRDLKPDNLFLVDRGDDAIWLKILDFGISKATRDDVGPSTLTRDGVVLGTPHYLSPEQAMGEPLDARSDLFSVGTILFECLTGQTPTQAAATYEAVVVAICTKDTPDVRAHAPGISPDLARIVARARARDREARYDSADALLSALRAAMPTAVSVRTGRSSSADAVDVGAPTELAPTGSTWSNRRAQRDQRLRSAFALGGAVIAAAFVATVLVLRAREPAPRAADLAPRPAPALSMRVVAPADAVVRVDGVASEGRVVSGVALSEHEIVVELPGGERIVRRVRLDGSPEIVVAAHPSAPPAVPPASSIAPALPPPVASRRLQAPTATGAAPSASGPTLQLKVDP